MVETLLVFVVIGCVGILTFSITTARIIIRDAEEKFISLSKETKLLRERSTLIEKNVEQIGKAATDALDRADEISNKIEIQKAMNIR